MEPLPAGPYDLILADPPWHFGGWADEPDLPNNRGPIRHYPTAKVDDLRAIPVGGIAARHSVLMLWSTMLMLPDALGLMAAWGFTYKTAAFTWTKLNADGTPFLGLGYYTRQNAELCLLGTRGKGLPRAHKDVPSAILSCRREHSRKPDGQYDRIERLFGPDVRRLELFARRRWPGWDAWGNEAPAEDALMLDLNAAG